MLIAFGYVDNFAGTGLRLLLARTAYSGIVRIVDIGFVIVTQSR